VTSSAISSASVAPSPSPSGASSDTSGRRRFSPIARATDCRIQIVA
jgi:hypothetical protein